MAYDPAMRDMCRLHSIFSFRQLGRLLLLGALAVACAEGEPGPPGETGPTGGPGPAGSPGSPGPEGPGLQTVFLMEVGRYVPNPIRFDESAAEITAFDPATNQVFVINADAGTVDVLALIDPSAPTLAATISSTTLGGSPNSIAASSSVAAVAVEIVNAQDTSQQLPGRVVFLRTSDQSVLSTVTVGPQPDMLTFTPDGSKVLVANEGEPNDDLSINPEGSVSIIDVSGGFTNPTVTQVGFTDFNVGGSRASEFPARQIFPGATRAEDVEPEYIAVSPDSSTAYVVLQEHNALAVINVDTASVVAILDLGLKDYNLIGNEFDASDRDGGKNLRNWPVFGMYQPDGIAAYQAGDGRTYLVTANEGDAVEYDGFTELVVVGEAVLDPAVFSDADVLQRDENLGRLETSSTASDLDGDPEFERIVAYGGRSFSVWDGTTGALLYDSGNEFERLTALRLGTDFNASNDANVGDVRSVAKGPEPEDVAVGRVGRRTYAFIGLERVGGIMVYDVTQPQAPFFVQYVNNRDFGASNSELETGTAGDLGPEGLTFVSADDSPNGIPLLIVGNEVTGTTTIYEIVLE